MHAACRFYPVSFCPLSLFIFALRLAITSLLLIHLQHQYQFSIKIECFHSTKHYHLKHKIHSRGGKKVAYWEKLEAMKDFASVKGKTKIVNLSCVEHLRSFLHCLNPPIPRNTPDLDLWQISAAPRCRPFVTEQDQVATRAYLQLTLEVRLQQQLSQPNTWTASTYWSARIIVYSVFNGLCID